MTHSYSIQGMTCSSCKEKVTQALQSLPDITKVVIDLKHQRAEVSMSKHVHTAEMQAALQAVGKQYSIEDEMPGSEPMFHEEAATSYKPLLLVVGFITAGTLLVQWPLNTFSIPMWMNHFMAMFFIVFSFFKFLDLEGFADSYRTYDVIAMRLPSWGYIYPFVELALGVAFLINWNMTFTLISTIVVMGISSIGVIQSVLDRKRIRCACLGTVFNLPMSTVTIVEDLGMVAMAVGMLVLSF